MNSNRPRRTVDDTWLRQSEPITSGTIYIPSDDETFVYQMFSWNDDLLYVGITSDLFSRWSGHKRESFWIDQVCYIRWDIFSSVTLCLNRRVGGRQNS